MKRSARTTTSSLVLPHLDAGYNLARWPSRNAHGAQDIVQDACVRALKCSSALHGRMRRRGFTIIRHASYGRAAVFPGALAAEAPAATP